MLNSDTFKKLYTSSDSDESITSFENGIGFAIVKKYKGKTEYAKDNRRMFIRLYLTKENCLNGGVEMVDAKKKESNSYRIVYDNKYNNKISNFSFSEKEKFIFDEEEEKIVYKATEEYFTVNEFINILICNHLSDKFFLSRILNKIRIVMLKSIFWLSNKHYDKIEVIVKMSQHNQEFIPDKSDEKNIEPFFKYFLISKNILVVFLLALFIGSILFMNFFDMSNLSMSNLYIASFLFLMLFILEKISIILDGKIRDFFMKKKNFIYRLYHSQFNNSFKLKLKK